MSFGPFLYRQAQLVLLGVLVRLTRPRRRT